MDDSLTIFGRLEQLTDQRVELCLGMYSAFVNMKVELYSPNTGDALKDEGALWFNSAMETLLNAMELLEKGRFGVAGMVRYMDAHEDFAEEWRRDGMI